MHESSGNELVSRLEKKIAGQEAELQRKDRELEIQAALDKVRVRAAAMRESSELAETSAILFQQVKELRIEAIRTGVGIFDEPNDAMELWLTTYTGDKEVVRILDYVNMHIHPVFENILPARQQKKAYALTILEGDQVKRYYQTMSTYLAMGMQGKLSEREYYYSFFFSQGAINVVSDKSLSEEELNILTRFAQVFGLIYTRFQDLQKTEEARKKIEEALAELKATQTQLIHSEKMASLGELTAGIAHEIQNPLNFVNNFSELNVELLAEMKGELESGNPAAALELVRDILENNEKIVYHGKRADSIVKGMLQHSRNSTGQKEPTEINTLVEECLRLSYHGLRAKDKSFNARFETAFDPAIKKINIVPQEIGRVVLNLINNAFYAVSEKNRQQLPGYEPLVTVSTKNQWFDIGVRGEIKIIISDNGNGIPERIREKIFQPFFTTKPTGEGTGLGLSLSFDIVKAHGGELGVNSREGEGTSFIITLPY